MTQNLKSPESAAPTEEPHTLEAAHRDIAFGNSYRIEYIKHLVSISTGVFVFSVKSPRAGKWRRTVNRRRKVAESAQIYGFVAGLMLLLSFAAWNLFV